MSNAPQTTPIRTLGDFVGVLENLPAGFGGGRLWFRGQPNLHWSPRPGTLRRRYSSSIEAETDEASESREPSGADAAAEIAMNAQFRRRSVRLIEADVDLVDLYFLARHHGLPSRLLDWSTNPLAALFFAVVERPKQDGVVLVIDPEQVVRRSPDRPAERPPFEKRHPWIVRTVRYLFGEGDCPEEKAILPILPEFRHTRMEHQGSCFTLHMPGAPPLDHCLQHRFQIPRECKRGLYDVLQSLGIGWASLFPDLDHLAMEIREQAERQRPKRSNHDDQ